MVIGTMLDKGIAVKMLCRNGDCQPCVPAQQLAQVGLCRSPESLWVVATASSMSCALLFLGGILIWQRKRGPVAAPLA